LAALANRVGPWRHAHETFTTPSQDWLFRALASGARPRAVPHPTVFAIPAALRAPRQPGQRDSAADGSGTDGASVTCVRNGAVIAGRMADQGTMASTSQRMGGTRL
jgi:hypothetical protein